jgi:hypothetical protein
MRAALQVNIQRARRHKNQGNTRRYGSEHSIIESTMKTAHGDVKANGVLRMRTVLSARLLQRATLAREVRLLPSCCL